MKRNMQKLDALLKQAGDLSSLPEVYIRVNELLDTDNATAIQIGDAL
jgi:hypothetical protein